MTKTNINVVTHQYFTHRKTQHFYCSGLNIPTTLSHFHIQVFPSCFKCFLTVGIPSEGTKYLFFEPIIISLCEPLSLMVTVVAN